MLDEIYRERQAKLEKIRQLGFDPYGGRYDSAEPVRSVLARYQDDMEGQSADAAGRLVLLRDMGKLIFAQVRDGSGTLQIALRKNVLDEKTWALAKLLDLGDIVAAAGPLAKTRTGEVTVFAERLTLLTKSLLPLPEKYHGLQDREIRYRQRYLDLAVNEPVMDTFRKRVAIIQTVRDVLRGRGYLEVETPMMQRLYGGAAARPFLTHHNALDLDLYLRISPELYLKRLLVGGMEKVFEVNRNFRNEGIDTRHNPEFTMLELYEARADYHVMMDIAEQIVTTAAREVCGALTLPYGDLEIDYTAPWPRPTYDELLQRHAGVSFRDGSAVRAKARQLGLDEANKADAVVANELFELTVEPHMIQPTFVRDYPAELCPLTRRDPADETIALRFELYVAGMELANAYTELNDPAVQEANFRRQLLGEAENETMRVMDDDFVTALKHGMPPAGGMGIGIDRLVMLLTGQTSIRDVVLFPLLRPQE